MVAILSFSSILGYLLKLIVPIIVVSGWRDYFTRRGYNESSMNTAFLKGKPSIIIISVLAVIYAGLIIYGFIKSPGNDPCVCLFFEYDHNSTYAGKIPF